MSVPTKTGQDVWKDIEAYELKYHTLSNLRKQKWVLLEDHQKEITRKRNPAIILDEEAQNAFKLQLSKEGWLSPSEIINLIDECFKRGIIDFDQRYEIINVFGAGGAKPK